MAHADRAPEGPPRSLEVDLAVTRAVSPEIARCELTFLEREPIDYALATEQHEQYRAMLKECGLEVVVVPADERHPDCCFIEDTAVVFDEVAIITRMGTAARRGEEHAVESTLKRYRRTEKVQPPATVDGGDVLHLGRTVFIGRTERTNDAGIDAVRRFLVPFGYRVVPVEVTGCLHLKSACTAIDDETILANPHWANFEPFAGLRKVWIPDDEPGGADVLQFNDVVCMHSGFPRTCGLVRSLGVTVHTVDLSEFVKAEAGPTCLSLLLSRIGAEPRT